MSRFGTMKLGEKHIIYNDGELVIYTVCLKEGNGLARATRALGTWHESARIKWDSAKPPDRAGLMQRAGHKPG